MSRQEAMLENLRGNLEDLMRGQGELRELRKENDFLRKENHGLNHRVEDMVGRAGADDDLSDEIANLNTLLGDYQKRNNVLG